ncbi:MAG: HigA family addiction module antitoxin [Pseudomonadota bacterium]
MPRLRFRNPIHPGEMLREEFLIPMEMSAGALAKHIGVPRTRIERLVREETTLSVDTAVRLARYFNMTEEFWINLQKGYELDCADADAELQAALAKIEPRELPPMKGDEAA